MDIPKALHLIVFPISLISNFQLRSDIMLQDCMSKTATIFAYYISKRSMRARKENNL